MPGISSSLDSLITKASLLPRIRLQAPEKVVGSNTNDCMESGIVFGTAAMIEGMTARIEEELGYPVTVVGTGGLGRVVFVHCQREIRRDDTLLLEGLRIIYEKNRKAV